MRRVTSRELWNRLIDRFRRDRLDRELTEELRFHQQMLEREYDDVHRAKRQLGNATYLREEARRLWSLGWVDDAVQDVRHAARGLRRDALFTTAVVATLALGIGANAAIFGIVDRMLFRPPPLLRNADAVHRVYRTTFTRGAERTSGIGAYARYTDITAGTTSFRRTAAFTETDLAVGTGDAAREMRIGAVSASFFDFFDAPPVLGRYFTVGEDAPPSGTPVAVMSYPTWRTEFGQRAGVLGTKVQIGSGIFTIIGVAPPGFVGLWPNQPPAYFIPITSAGAESAPAPLRSRWWKTYQWDWLDMIAERKPGVSIADANADVRRAIAESYTRLIAENPRTTPAKVAKPTGAIASVLSERGPTSSNVAKVAVWVGAMALIVLLVACANVANLLLARALRRRRETAVRLALGISRSRLLFQRMAESLVLAAIGAIAGMLVAHWGDSAFRSAFVPGSAAPRALNDPRTYAFAAILAAGAALLTGVIPAIDSLRLSFGDALGANARAGTSPRSRLRLGLLIVQGALSAMLLIGAGLFVRSLHNVRNARLGYDTDRIAVVELNMRGMTLDPAQNVELRTRLLARARSIPGVEHATLQVSIPFWTARSTRLFVAGIDSVDKLGRFDYNAVSPDYFATMGTRVLRGRSLSESDGATAPRVMVVSEAMAKRLWPGADAIGQCVRLSADTMPCTTVVGIAENIRATQLSDDPGLHYYLPIEQFGARGSGLFLRTSGAAASAVEGIRRELQREMPGLSYVSVSPFSNIVGRQTRSWQLGATMFLVFGALALVVAAVGTYGVIAYAVTQRTHEIGVRAALGAQARDIAALVIGSGMRVTAVGVALGVAGALAAARWVQPLLYEESSRDPVVLLVVVATLFAVAGVASAVPARRAASVDPQAALRVD